MVKPPYNCVIFQLTQPQVANQQQQKIVQYLASILYYDGQFVVENWVEHNTNTSFNWICNVNKRYNCVKKFVAKGSKGKKNILFELVKKN